MNCKHWVLDVENKEECELDYDDLKNMMQEEYSNDKERNAQGSLL